jgi:FeS assembly SUF system regulator
MLRLSKLTDYGTVIMSHMARRPAGLHSAGEIAFVLGVAAPTVSKVLKRLVRARLLLSVRGAQGGYRLARPPDAISLADVIDALEGPIGITECSAMTGLCSQENACPVRGHWQWLNRIVLHSLDGVTLAEMSRARWQPHDVPVRFTPKVPT